MWRRVRVHTGLLPGGLSAASERGSCQVCHVGGAGSVGVAVCSANVAPRSAEGPTPRCMTDAQSRPRTWARHSQAGVFVCWCCMPHALLVVAVVVHSVGNSGVVVMGCSLARAGGPDIRHSVPSRRRS